MAQQCHRIKQQILELQISADIPIVPLQNQVSDLCRNQVIPIIEAHLDQVSPPDQVYRIDRLEIDLGEIDLNTLESTFVQKVVQQLSEQLSQRLALLPIPSSHPAKPPRDPGVQWHVQPCPVPPIEIHFEILRDFIYTGRLPWWCEPLSSATLAHHFAQLQTNAPTKLKMLLQDSLQQIQLRQRILHQFPEPLLFQILQLLASSSVAIVQAYLHDIEILASYVPCWQGISRQELKRMIWQGILLQLSLNLTVQPKAEIILWTNLLHLAARLNIQLRSLLGQLQTAVESVSQANIHLASQLPQILTSESHTKVPEKARPKIQLTTSLKSLVECLTELDQWADTTSMSSLLRSSINALQQQLNTLDLQGTHPFYDVTPPTHKTVDFQEIRLQLNRLIAHLEQSAAAPQWHQIITRLKAIARNDSSTATETPLFEHHSSPELRSTKSNRVQPHQDEPIYIQNAGLVLLWPFLNRFFENLDLVESEQFLNAQATYRAILFLQYLVEASIESLESGLSLNKILCGLDLAESIPINLDPSAIESNQCEALLLALIQNWSVLKNTSIKGLRQAFLQRTGMLRLRPTGWLLQVEHQTYDVLVEQLPWQISVIKLPWMLQILYVEW